MRVVNRNYEDIAEYDLSIGFLIPCTVIKENAKPIDNVTKFAWDAEDYEDAQMYILTKTITYKPSEQDKIDAQVTYTAMMTNTLLEV